jgi:hypothetical protein
VITSSSSSDIVLVTLVADMVEQDGGKMTVTVVAVDLCHPVFNKAAILNAPPVSCDSFYSDRMSFELVSVLARSIEFCYLSSMRFDLLTTCPPKNKMSSSVPLTTCIAMHQQRINEKK